MRNSILGGVLISALLMLTGCGGDSGSESDVGVSASGFKAVAIHDMATGEQLALHKVEQISPDTTRLLTVQHAGNDAVWGTADDVLTARTTCTYAASGKTIDERLQQVDLFWPEQLKSVSASACLLVRPDVSGVDVVIEGGMRSAGDIELFRSIASSPTGQIMLNVLGWTSITMVGLEPLEFRFMAQDGGIRTCAPDCALLPQVPPPSVSCNLNCEGIGNLIYNPYAGTGEEVPLEGPIYAGAQYSPIFSQNGTLEKVSLSRDLEHPDEHVIEYQRFQRDSRGRDMVIEIFRPSLTSLPFGLQTDDTLLRRDIVQAVRDGLQRIRYTGPGEDGRWNTSDDVIGSVATLYGRDGRVERVEACSAAGTDGTWLTPDDSCHLLSFMY